MTRRGLSIETLGCRHTMHRLCLERTIDAGSKRCPLCREPITHPADLARRSPMSDAERAARLALFMWSGMGGLRDVEVESARFYTRGEDNRRFRHLVAHILALLETIEDDHEAPRELSHLKRRSIVHAMQTLVDGNPRQYERALDSIIGVYQSQVSRVFIFPV